MTGSAKNSEPKTSPRTTRGGTPRPRCAATTKAGNPCPNSAIEGSTYCVPHARWQTADPSQVPAAARRFGGAEAGALGGRPKRKTATEIWRDMVERNLLVILQSHFVTLGVTAEMTEDGIVLTPVEGGGAKLSATFEGRVYVSEADDLKAQMLAAQSLIERALGRPAQSIALTGDGGGPVLLRLGEAMSADAARAADDLAEQLALEAGDDGEAR